MMGVERKNNWIVKILKVMVLLLIAIFIIATLNLLVFRIGNYDSYIVVDDNMVVDYSLIEKERTDINGTSVHWFTELKENQKLIDYTRDNNLKIKPGLYVIERYASFEEIKKILVFEKISDNSKIEPTQ